MIFNNVSTSTFFFDGGGDFEISNNDIMVITGNMKVRIQALKDFLRSNYNDYAYNPNMAANLDVFIGRGIDENLKAEFDDYLKRGIIASKLFEASEFNVYSVISGSTLVFRIILREAEDEIIQITYSTALGVTID